MGELTPAREELGNPGRGLIMARRRGALEEEGKFRQRERRNVERIG